jgi:hypothetical protein
MFIENLQLAYDGGVDFWGLLLLAICVLGTGAYAAACWIRKRRSRRCVGAVPAAPPLLCMAWHFRMHPEIPPPLAGVAWPARLQEPAGWRRHEGMSTCCR